MAIGELIRVEGLALAGAELAPAEGPMEMRAAWAALGDDVGVVILTRTAAEAVKGLGAPARRLQVVMPE